MQKWQALKNVGYYREGERNVMGISQKNLEGQ